MPTPAQQLQPAAPPGVQIQAISDANHNSETATDGTVPAPALETVSRSSSDVPGDTETFEEYFDCQEDAPAGEAPMCPVLADAKPIAMTGGSWPACIRDCPQLQGPVVPSRIS